MRHIALAILIALAPLAARAQEPETAAQVAVTNQNAILRNGDRDRNAARFSADWWATLKGPLGGWGYGYAERNYGETVHGLYLLLPFGFEIGAAAGVESYFSQSQQLYTDSVKFRYAAILGLGDADKLGIEVYAENGPSRNSEGKRQPWARVFANWQVNSTLALGALGQFARDETLTDGFGPRIGLTLPDIPVEIYGSTSLINLGESRWNTLFGLKVTKNWLWK